MFLMEINSNNPLTFLCHVVHAVGHCCVLVFGVQKEETCIFVDKMIVWKRKDLGFFLEVRSCQTLGEKMKIRLCFVLS